MGGRAGMGWRVFFDIKIKKPAKRPIREKKATIKKLKVPWGIKETVKIKGKIISPAPKSKKYYKA